MDTDTAFHVTVDLVLASVDTSDRSEAVVEYAVAVADRYGADLHLLYVVDGQVQHGEDDRGVAPESVAADHREFTDWVHEQLPEGVSLSQSTATGFSTVELSRTPGSAVLDAAEELEADFLVVPRQAGGDPDEVLGKVAVYILEYASQPVLSV